MTINSPKSKYKSHSWAEKAILLRHGRQKRILPSHVGFTFKGKWELSHTWVSWGYSESVTFGFNRSYMALEGIDWWVKMIYSTNDMPIYTGHMVELSLKNKLFYFGLCMDLCGDLCFPSKHTYNPSMLFSLHRCINKPYLVLRYLWKQDNWLSSWKISCLCNVQ